MADTWEAAHSAIKTGIIAYPTEAVFGLGCDPRNEVAVQRLLSLETATCRERSYINCRRLQSVTSLC